MMANRLADDYWAILYSILQMISWCLNEQQWYSTYNYENSSLLLNCSRLLKTTA